MLNSPINEREGRAKLSFSITQDELLALGAKGEKITDKVWLEQARAYLRVINPLLVARKVKEARLVNKGFKLSIGGWLGADENEIGALSQRRRFLSHNLNALIERRLDAIEGVESNELLTDHIDLVTEAEFRRNEARFSTFEIERYRLSVLIERTKLAIDGLSTILKENPNDKEAKGLKRQFQRGLEQQFAIVDNVKLESSNIRLLSGDIARQVLDILPIEQLSEYLMGEGKADLLGQVLGLPMNNTPKGRMPASPFIPADKVRPITLQDLVARTAG